MITWQPFKGEANAIEGFVAGYGLYVICWDDKATHLQGATMKKMSTVCKDVDAAKAMAEDNALQFTKAIKEAV